eukprot:11932692-Ditylum_brightwellii.AAC.1
MFLEPYIHGYKEMVQIDVDVHHCCIRGEHLGTIRKDSRNFLNFWRWKSSQVETVARSDHAQLTT